MLIRKSSSSKEKDDSSIVYFDEMTNDDVEIALLTRDDPGNTNTRQRRGMHYSQDDDHTTTLHEIHREPPLISSSHSYAASTFSASRTVYKTGQRRRRRTRPTHFPKVYPTRFTQQWNAIYLLKEHPVVQWFWNMPPSKRNTAIVSVLTSLCIIIVLASPASQDNPAAPIFIPQVITKVRQSLVSPLKTLSSRRGMDPPKETTTRQGSSSKQNQKDPPLANHATQFKRVTGDKKAQIPSPMENKDTDSKPVVKQLAVVAYQHGHHGDYLPHHLKDSFANIWDDILNTDVPLFWHIPKSGGTTVADILTHCLNLVSASKIGATEGRGNEPILEVNLYQDKGRYVNADTSTLDGLERARELGLIPSGLADVVVTHRFHEGAALFDPAHRARAFAMFRHPVRRAISMFYYLQRATWEPTYDPTLADMTLEEYATSGRAEENWVTRFLTTEYQDKLTDQHVELAKEILRRKIVVGLLEKFDESMKRFELYFSWWEDIVKKNPERSIRCQQGKTQAAHNQVPHPNPPESSSGFLLLAQLNWADMEVYNYAVQLFEEQAGLVKNASASLA